MPNDMLPAANPDGSQAPKRGLEKEDIVLILQGYRREGTEARKSGMNSRDDVWNANIDLYWGRYDFSKKAAWQAQEVMPEAAMFVDRWAAALREALNSADEWYTVEFEGDPEGDLSKVIKKFTDVWLKRAGRTQTGHQMDFSGVFEEQMKLGAMAACCGTVTWKERDGEGYVAIETVDPRTFWMDPTGRWLYRFRDTEIDLHELMELANTKDDKGQFLYDREEISRLSSSLAEEVRQWRDTLSGLATASQADSAAGRKPIKLTEFLCTLVDVEGEVVGRNVLCILANDQFLIRGPEANPFWHQKDWSFYAPMITVPLSVYGRSYMENWSSVARTFIEMTNLIIDSAFTSAMKAFAVNPDMLEDPTQLATGIHPNKIFIMEEGVDPEKFLKEIELGRMPPEVIAIWKELKAEMREGAALSEISLGQSAPKGRTSATEINSSQQNSGALVRSIARTIEVRFLEVLLNLVWKVAIQHYDENDVQLNVAMGEEAMAMLNARRQELASTSITFMARGVSALVDRSTKLNTLLQALQVIGQSEVLAQAFTANSDASKILAKIFVLFGIDMKDFQLSAREQQVAQIEQKAAAALEQQAAGEAQAQAQAGEADATAADQAGQAELQAQSADEQSALQAQGAEEQAALAAQAQVVQSQSEG